MGDSGERFCINLYLIRSLQGRGLCMVVNVIVFGGVRACKCSASSSSQLAYKGRRRCLKLLIRIERRQRQKRSSYRRRRCPHCRQAPPRTSKRKGEEKDDNNKIYISKTRERTELLVSWATREKEAPRTWTCPLSSKCLVFLMVSMVANGWLGGWMVVSALSSFLRIRFVHPLRGQGTLVTCHLVVLPECVCARQVDR